MNTVFTQYYRMPLLVLFLTFAWMMISIRIVSFLRVRQQNPGPSASGWNSFLGAGVGLSIFAGVIAIVYVVLNIAVYCLDQEIFKFFDPIAITSDQVTETLDPSTISGSDVRWLQKILKSMLLMLSSGRVFLILTLWIVKGSLYTTYMQSQNVLGGVTRSVVLATGPILVTTGTLVVWISLQSLTISFSGPTTADIRNGAYMDGVTFGALDDTSELTISALNVVTDALLTFIAYKAVRALHHPISATWLLFIMGFITIKVAVVRLAFVIISKACQGPCLETETLNRIITPEAFLAEVEVFAAIIVSCLPGLRAALRKEDPEAVENFVPNAWMDRGLQLN